ncbi:hypothetical protein [Qipengyuania gaetbuli]|uniref:hypothetical protein n=1 Tax=Qipengyuania gaetbuli TaxID=266952 RepID=UPI001CFE9C13|nr:hypothetical protein [Qipengyuania gaetbuli]
MRVGIRVSVAALVVALPAAANAEVLTVEGIYAARDAGAIEVEEITIERFGGEVGERLAIALTDRLEGVQIDGERYFNVRAGSSGGDNIYIYGADTPASEVAAAVEAGPVSATMRGTASGEVSDYRSGSTKKTRCVKKDEDKNCVEERVDVYECRTMTVSFSPSLRLIAREGGTLYAADGRHSQSQNYCANEYSQPSANKMMDALVDGFATRVRLDLAPEFRREDIRVLESRKGLAKQDSKDFKTAVRLTKNDQLAACIRFEELAGRNPEQVSAIFNAGLCAERDGRLEEAADLYGRALATGESKDYSEAGLDRVSSRLEAERQLSLRYPLQD